MHEPAHSLREVWRLLEADVAATAGYAADFFGGGMSLSRRLSILCMPGVLCCALHRLAHWAWCRRRRRLARLFALLNYVLHKANLSPAAHIGPGLYIPHTVGIVFHGTAGHRLTLYAYCQVAPSRPQPAFGLRLDDAPRLGHRVTVGAYSVLHGAVRVGDDVRIGPNVDVRQDLPAGARVLTRTRPNLPRRGATP